ncbi:MAG: hypothetical protein U9Q83_00930 [Bacteroidota bacterium]|nr:hypothetical protein [Bacteroidota bacterium]
MLKKVIYLVLFSVISLYSCNNGVTFYLNESTETTIEGSLPFNLNVPFNIPVGLINNSSSDEFENNKTIPSLINEVSLNKVTVTITSPADEDFSFLEAIHISIEYSDGSNKKEIAYLDNISSSATSIELDITNENLVPYLQEDSYKIDTEVTVKEAPGHDIDLKIDLKFKITANILQ